MAMVWYTLIYWVSLTTTRDLGKSITKPQRDEAFRKVGVYRKWMLETVLQQDQRDAFVILPIADVAPNYRDTQPG
jgi:hypothetical protein